MGRLIESRTNTVRRNAGSKSQERASVSSGGIDTGQRRELACVSDSSESRDESISRDKVYSMDENARMASQVHSRTYHYWRVIPTVEVVYDRLFGFVFGFRSSNLIDKALRELEISKRINVVLI